MIDMSSKSAVRRMLRDRLSAIGPQEHHSKSSTANTFLVQTDEFKNARIVMIYLSTAEEVDTASLALKCWQTGKTVVAPKVSWDQKRMLPVEISSLTVGMTRTGPGINERFRASRFRWT